MPVLQVNDVAKSFGEVLILEGISFSLYAKEKVALLGMNGCGKTTLLKIIAGRLTSDEGSVQVASGGKAYYLEQEPQFMVGDSLYQAVGAVFSPVWALEKQMRTIEEQMANEDETSLPRLLKRYSELTEQYEVLGGYGIDAAVKRVLMGLGFAESDFSLAVDHLSGGQRVRASLAKALLEAPEVLLLDEPTNHLDLAAVEWLEGFLPTYEGAVLIVSHDRHFLDKVVTRCLELENQKISEWPGNFSKYRALKAERLLGQNMAYGREQAEMKRMKEFINRYRAGSRATLSKSWARRLERREKSKTVKPQAKSMLSLSVTERRRSGRDVLEICDLGIAFGQTSLFAPFSAQVKRGERIALLGPNGCGKTSLLRALLGEVPSSGTVRWGANVEIGYFDQRLTLQRATGTVLEQITSLASDMSEWEARSYLAQFLFRGESVFACLSTLSGGERSRLSLARLLLRGGNVLLLDEPTNHLDIESREVLERALLGFTGTIIFVSHDRYFLDKVATRLWQFTANRSIADHKQNYSNWRQKELFPVVLAIRVTKKTNISQPTTNDLTLLEREITRLEREKLEKEEYMASRDFIKLKDGSKVIIDRYLWVLSRLKELIENWEREASKSGL